MNQLTQLIPAGVSVLDLALLQASKERGRHPFAAWVADRNSWVIVEAGNNSMPPQGDPTLYTSAEPCCMCAGAVYWTGIGRVVYALSEPPREEARA